MKYGALLFWGIAIYAIMTLAWSGLSIYGFTGTILSRLLILLTLIVIATIAGRSLRFHSWKDVLPYSFLWAVMMGLLDAVYSVPFGGWVIYADWNLWVGYTLVAVVPMLAPLTRLNAPVHES